jgi:hypothetical protein
MAMRISQGEFEGKLYEDSYEDFRQKSDNFISGG